MEGPPNPDASRGETRIVLLPWLVAAIVLVALAAGFAAKRRDSARQAGRVAPAPELEVIDRRALRDESGQPTTTLPDPASIADPAAELEPAWSTTPASETPPQDAVEAENETVPSYGWYEGANGFLRGLDEANQQGQAMAVYFYTDWCPYCRELENELLYRARVEEFLKYLVKIRINPEDGSRERAIADEYGVRGYPSFFIQSSAGARPRKMRRTTGGRLMTPEEFIAALDKAAG